MKAINISLEKFAWKYYRWAKHWNPARLRILINRVPDPEFRKLTEDRRKEIMKRAAL